MSLNDTESRLRDYLSTKAASVVPDTATPPQLVDERGRSFAGHRRTWPALAAAAAVLAIVVPLLVRIGDKAEPSGASGAPITVPYVIGNTLYDGDVKVSGPDGLRVLSRVADGWLVSVMPPPKPGQPKSRIGILSRSGQFTQRGADAPIAAVASPDGTQVAVLEPRRSAAAPETLRVLDLKSGRQLSSHKAFRSTTLHGWNGHGIWYSQRSTDAAGLNVWQPGKSASLFVPVDHFDHGVVTVRGTDRMIVTTRVPDQSCIRVVELRSTGRLETLRQHCSDDRKAMYPALSPDGRTVTVAQHRIAIDVDSGRLVKLHGLPDGYFLGVRDLYENPSNVLVVLDGLQTPSAEPGSVRPSRGDTSTAVYRCDVRTGTCQTALQTPDRISLGAP